MQFLALPYALNNEAVGSIDVGTTDWIGEVQSQDWGVWIDYAFLLLLGGIPWQCYYQRVLSSKTATRAQMLSYGGGKELCFLINTIGSLHSIKTTRNLTNKIVSFQDLLP